jgi:hypothetical protein
MLMRHSTLKGFTLSKNLHNYMSGAGNSARTYLEQAGMPAPQDAETLHVRYPQYPLQYYALAKRGAAASRVCV